MYFFIRTFICCIFLSFSFCYFNHEYPEKHGALVNSGHLTLSEDKSYRVPTNCTPKRYNLLIWPFFVNGTFKGQVNITFDVLNSTNSIVMNLDNKSIPLTSIEASVQSSSQFVTIVNKTVDSIHQMVTFLLNDTLTIQQGAIMQMSYWGYLSDDMQGFYSSTYKTSSDNHVMAITQFESTYARRAFPSFDEPRYRANFSISIMRLPNETSMSNMPLNKSDYDNSTGMMVDKYDMSPPMPTYLVAFGMGSLASISDGTNRIFARKDAIIDAEYVKRICQPILDNIGNQLNIPYPLPKMDVVAVPDFAAGAMENWGLTTFREKYVLFDPMKNTWRDKFGVLSVVAHEFGHQWFGDLVTPEWWDYAWLNEAFATYYEYTVPNMIEPQWGVGSNMYVVQAVQNALDLDTGNPRPMTSPVYTPDDIESIFDYVIYEKGGSILRMTENFLTTPVWREGQKRYLTENAYKTGTPDKLFSALQDVADAANATGLANTTGLPNVTKILQGWTTQPGYPLVTITQMNSTNSSSTYYITQTPYSISDNSSNTTWIIPLTYTTQSNPVFNATMATKHWLLSTNGSTHTVTTNGSGWIICNVDQVGFYRVNYDAINWAKLKAQLNSNHTVISPVNRGQLIDDAFHLAHSGNMSYNLALGLTEYFPNETAIVPLNAFIKNMGKLINTFEGTSTGDGLKQYSRDMMTKVFRNLTANLTQTRSTFPGAYTLEFVSIFSCCVGLEDCISKALAEFYLWKQNTSGYIIPPEVKQAVLCTGLQHNTSIGALMDVLDLLFMSNNAAEKLTIMNALGCQSSEETIYPYLDIVCDSNANRIRLQDRWIAMNALVLHQPGIPSVLGYIAKNYNKVIQAIGDKLQRVISTLANRIYQQSHINQVQNILNDNSVDPSLKNMLNSTVIPAIKKHKIWASSQPAASLVVWVDTNVKSSAGVSFTALNVIFSLIPAALIILNH